MAPHRWRASENYLGAVFYPMLLGPLALISYSRVGFLVMLIPWLISLALVFLLIGVLLVPLVHFVCVIWAVASVPSNRRRRADRQQAAKEKKQQARMPAAPDPNAAPPAPSFRSEPAATVPTYSTVETANSGSGSSVVLAVAALAFIAGLFIGWFGGPMLLPTLAQRL